MLNTCFSHCSVLSMFPFLFNQPQLKASAVYGCSFVAKLSWKKIFFLKKQVFYKIYIICRKNVFIWKKCFILKNFLLKKTFFTKKNINENVKKYISHLRNIFFCRKCLLMQIKYKSLLNIYSFCKKKKKKKLIIKNLFVKTSL